MTARIETIELVEPWLYQVLHGDSTLNTAVGGRFDTMLGDGGADLDLPKVQWAMVSTRDVANAQGQRIDTDNLYDIKVIGEGSSFGPLATIASRIDTLLDGQVYTFPGGGSLTCVRERIIQMEEPVIGVKYLHLGATYRIRCSKD